MSLYSDRLAAGSTDAMLGPNPFVGFKARDIAREVVRIGKLLAQQPRVTGRTAGALAKEVLSVIRGESSLAAAPRDKRFADPAWTQDARYKRWLQTFLALEKSIGQWLDEQHLPAHSRARLEFMISLITDALAPSNFPLQPEAVRRFKETNGQSAIAGLQNFLRDIRENRGLPAQVDKSQFKVGGNIANTPGRVVFRSEVIELIEYTPRTKEVRENPILFVPPQINKFYLFDMSPEKSVVKGVLDQGLATYMISWRNPNAEHAEWGLAEYAAAIDMAISAICNITGATQVNVVGACAGGLTVAAYVAARAASGDHRVNTLTLVVNVLDTKALGETPLGMFATERAIKDAKKKSQTKGVLDGKTMSAAFTWLRPNDLIWNYWVNNVLLGNKPPAFDLLYWNNDNTRLPAALHSEFMDIFQSAALTQPGKMRVLGVPVDMGKIRCDTYTLGGTTDHITPWKACYRNTQLFSGSRSRTFVLSNAGHMQSILNPPGNKKAEYWTGGELGPDPDAWKKSAEHHQGSWWPHWHQWLHERSGKMKPAPTEHGNEDYPPTDAAPGTYVYE